MFTTPDSGGNELVELLDDLGEYDADQAVTPRGPSGLLRALVHASCRDASDRVLPTVDAADVGAGQRLFDYERDLAEDYHGEFPLA